MFGQRVTFVTSLRTFISPLINADSYEKAILLGGLITITAIKGSGFLDDTVTAFSAVSRVILMLYIGKFIIEP
jgi:hypothetical protein